MFNKRMISILTTVYNGYEFLEECAKSIITQKCEHDGLHFSWEWWIGINGHGESGGEAMRIAEKIAEADSRIHVVNLPNVKGRVAALNSLRAMVHGEWIAIIDCDDIWEQEKLITQVAAIKMANTPIDVVGTFCSYFGDVVTTGPRLPSGWIRLKNVLQGNPIINSSALIRADLAHWEERFGLEDYDLWIRAIKGGHTLFNVPHPLVRHRIHKESAFNGKGGQDLRGLLDHHTGRPTVVTAYYPVPSKQTVTKYMEWITGFWPHMQCNLIFYTAPELVQTFQKIFKDRSNAIVVGIPFHSLTAFEKLSPFAWLDTQKLDTENVGHTAELYALWYEKKEFVARAINSNPFFSNEFVWCDAGIGRYPEWNSKIQGFPARGFIPRGKMLLLEIDPLQEYDWRPDDHGIRGEFTGRATFGGGILASDINGWNRWSMAYDAMLARYLLAGRFIGKDQNIMASMILEQPDLALVVRRPQNMAATQRWFYLLFFLAGLCIS